MPLTTDQATALADAVVAFLGVVDDDVKERAVSHVQVMYSLVKAYTRGVGFDVDGIPAEDLQTVILTATARLVTNPAQSSSESESSTTR